MPWETRKALCLFYKDTDEDLEIDWRFADYFRAQPAIVKLDVLRQGLQELANIYNRAVNEYEEELKQNLYKLERDRDEAEE